MSVSLYCTDIRALAPVERELGKKLPPDRTRAMRAFRGAGDRLRCLAGWLLMAHVLGRGGILDEGVIRKGPYGKPYLEGGPFFGLSHSGNYVLLALGEKEVGVDIEEWRDDDYLALAAASFHPLEREALAGDVSARKFFDFWTVKESYLKFLGVGLFRDPASFAVTLCGPSAQVAERPDISFRVYDALPGYSAALCAAASLPERMTRVEFA